MKNRIQFIFFVLVLFLMSCVKLSYGFQSVNSSEEEKRSKVQFHFKPKLGLNYTGNKFEGTWSNNLQWMLTVNSDINYSRPKFDLGSALFIQYGKSKITGQNTQKLKDLLILSITPSIPLIRTPAIRLFLETAGETSMTDGTMQNKPTGLCKPLFIYQSLFIGQKHYSNEKNEKTTWGMTYGIGYAFQQTINNHYDINHTKNDFESGFSGIIDFNLESQLSKFISLSIKAKAVALAKENPLKDLNSCRKSILFQTGLFYKKIGMEFNYHVVHDLNLSMENQIDRSLMLTIRF